MKHVSILIPRGTASVVNIGGTHQILSQVNTFLVQMGKPPLFKIQLVGVSKETRVSSGLFTINPDALIGDIQKTDLIIIPALHDNQKEVIERNNEFLPWIVQQYHNGAQVASMCIGAFFLAATGLLNGKPCATHWGEAGNFRKMYPQVELVDDKIMTESEGIFTSGGAYAFLNLLLYLIEKYAGREIAILVSKTYMIDINKESQSPFIIFRGQKEHEDAVVKKAQMLIEQNYREKLTVDALAEKLALGRRSLERRFKKATSNSVVEYMQRVKVEAAKKNLEVSHENVSEVMYKVGYNDPKAFRTIFKKITGLTPLEYRNKYNRAQPKTVN